MSPQLVAERFAILIKTVDKSLDVMNAQQKQITMLTDQLTSVTMINADLITRVIKLESKLRERGL